MFAEEPAEGDHRAEAEPDGADAEALGPPGCRAELSHGAHRTGDRFPARAGAYPSWPLAICPVQG